MENTFPDHVGRWGQHARACMHLEGQNLTLFDDFSIRNVKRPKRNEVPTYYAHLDVSKWFQKLVQIVICNRTKRHFCNRIIRYLGK